MGSKIKEKIQNEKEYKIFQSKKFIGMLVLVLFTFLFVVSLVDIPIFTTIHAYTFGFLFGYYSYFIYVALIFQGLVLVFNLDFLITKFFVKKLNRTFYFNWMSYCILVFGIALIIESSIFFMSNGKIFNGIASFEYYYDIWWNSFRSSNNPALPNTLNGGVVFIFFIALFSSIAGNIMTILVGSCLVLFCIYYFLCGSPFNLTKKENKNHKIEKKEKKEYETKILDLSYETTLNDSTLEIINPQINDIEDVHSTQEEFFRSKTEEITKKQNKTKTLNSINIDVANNNQEEKEDEQDTFEFELDVFNTNTSIINTDKIVEESIKKK